MEPKHAFILFQNQLFAEGLESILHSNNHNVFKRHIKDSNDLMLKHLMNVELLLIEVNWPYPSLETLIDGNRNVLGNGVKTILIPNLVNREIFAMVLNDKIDGIVLKSSNMDELFFAIKQVEDGRKYYSSMVASVFFKNSSKPHLFKVTKRERQILSLLAEMKTSSEIAKKLSITVSTVKTHRRNLMRKFNAKNILCLLRFACRENLLHDTDGFCLCCYKQFVGA